MSPWGRNARIKIKLDSFDCSFIILVQQQNPEQQGKMYDNFFQDTYQSYNKVYVHPETSNCIYLGDMQAAIDADFLSQQRVRTVITAAKDMDHIVFSPTIQHVVYPLLDSKQENITNFFDAFFVLVQKNIIMGNILVHCAAGISRSSTLVISYIMKKESKSFKEVIAHVRKQRPNVLPNLGFQRQLKQYELSLINASKSRQISRRGEVKTSESSKRSHMLGGQMLPHVSKYPRPKLNDILSINMKKLTEQFTEKDIKILRIYQNNRFIDNRKLFKQKINARNMISRESNAVNHPSNSIPQRQSVSQEMAVRRPIYRKRIKTHISNNIKNAELKNKLNTEHSRGAQFNFEF